MIDYKEVRIGNLVSYEGKEYRIAGIYKDYPFLDTIEFGAGVVEWKDLEPIPLTEERLLKFGFEKRKGNKFPTLKVKGSRFYTSRFNYFRVNVFQRCLTVQYSSNVKDKENDLYTIDNIQSIHQLQNLYFALTNKEL